MATHHIYAALTCTEGSSMRSEKRRSTRLYERSSGPRYIFPPPHGLQLRTPAVFHHMSVADLKKHTQDRILIRVWESGSFKARLREEKKSVSKLAMSTRYHVGMHSSTLYRLARSTLLHTLNLQMEEITPSAAQAGMDARGCPW